MVRILTLETNISHPKALLKMIFRFPRCVGSLGSIDKEVDVVPFLRTLRGTRKNESTEMMVDLIPS